MIALFAGAHGRPLLLVLDDMQWADQSTAFLLRHFVRSSLRGLMVITTRRPPQPGEYDLLSKVLQDLERETGARTRLLRVSLAGLDVRRDLRAGGRTQRLAVDHEFSRLLHARRRAPVLHRSGLTRTRRRRSLSRRGWRQGALRSLEVPQEVQDFIAYRLAGFTAGRARTARTSRGLRHRVSGSMSSQTPWHHHRSDHRPSTEPDDSRPRPRSGYRTVRLLSCAGPGNAVRASIEQERAGADAFAHRSALEGMERRVKRGSSRCISTPRAISVARNGGPVRVGRGRARRNSLAYEVAAAYTREACEALECLRSEHDPERSRLLQSAGRLRWQAGDQAGHRRTSDRRPSSPVRWAMRRNSLARLWVTRADPTTPKRSTPISDSCSPKPSRCCQRPRPRCGPDSWPGWLKRSVRWTRDVPSN